MLNGPAGLGGRIKLWREERGLSRLAFGQALGIGKSSANVMVRGWEMGRCHPTYWYLLELARFFEISMDTLCDVNYAKERGDDAKQ